MQAGVDAVVHLLQVLAYGRGQAGGVGHLVEEHGFGRCQVTGLDEAL